MANAAVPGDAMDGYAKYASKVGKATEAAFRGSSGYLRVDQDAEWMSRVRDGEIVTRQVTAPEVASGLIHHWVGAVFMNNVTMERMLKADQDYNNHDKTYAPDVQKSKLLKHSGNDFKVYYRFYKKQGITVVLDTIHNVNYDRVNPARVLSMSICRDVREVENAGTGSEKLLPPGEGVGALWAMDSYWRLAERDGGLYAECDALTLTRDLPLGLGRLFSPIIRSLADDAIASTLAAKRRSVTA